MWDEGQSEAVEGVLGTMNQLTIDRCMVEVREYHKNLTLAFCDYKKAYSTVHHS